ncbi:hypothetical protein MMC07_007466 [Pseudocyphellaria aurata]|nr:hypothetical protein [Pseudocyphellaria aurata]
MPRARPQLSITLPRNFTFHYTEGEELKTPEQETPVPVPQSPQAYRIKRRSRPNVSSITSDHYTDAFASDDIPIPTIETPASVEPSRPIFQQRYTEPAEGYLAPIPTRRFVTSPRTPSTQRNHLSDTWGLSDMQTPGGTISRPISACSILSDSSDDSNGSLSSYPSLGGSCTSPESDAPDPFTLPSIRKCKVKDTSISMEVNTSVKKSQTSKQNQVHWTPEMDRHLWGAYLVYLQDPTVTPFKMLPGVAPPLGVCHRVARVARRTWRGAKKVSRRSPDGGSPDTIKPNRSGSNTPTGLIISRPSPWPKSGASTRKRLRELCKRKPTIAPHYQRLLQARSSSPEPSHSRSPSLPMVRSSPFSHHSQQTPFATRGIQVSLAASTAASMQPDGPLAQLASRNARSPQSDRDWFNDPVVPWASPTAIPSDLARGAEEQMEMETPQLGSPFGYHTWGPSHSRQPLCPSVPRSRSGAIPVAGPSLQSPVRLHDTFPYPCVLKRRAQHQLEDELSPGGTDMRRNLLEDLFGGPSASRHRRVRSRGFSLGDVNSTGGRLESLFTPPAVHDEKHSPGSATESPTSGNLEPPSISDSVRRLGSPFAGVSSRPPRRSSRHMASASLSAYNHNNFSSIDQTMGQVNQDDGVWKSLRR